MTRVRVALGWWSLVAMLVATVAGGAAMAHAQARPPSAADDAEARTVYQAGVQAYESGRYDRALEYFRRAYELSRRPQLLYNIGQAADRLRRDEEALRAFEQFLAEVGDDPLRRQVEGRVAYLRESLAQAAQGEAAPSTTTQSATTQSTTTQSATTQSTTDGTAADPVEPTSDSTRTSAVGDPATAAPPPSSASGGGDVTGAWALLIAGGVVAITGAVMLGVAAAENGAVQDAPPRSDWSDYEGRLGAANGLAIGGGVALGVGAVAAVIGAVWMAGSGGAGREEDVRVGIGPGTIVVEGSF